MKSILASVGLALFLFSGCGSDGDNPVGGGLARTREPERIVDSASMTLTRGKGLAEAYSRRMYYGWSSSGVCRSGFFKKDTFYSCLELVVSAVPRDFDTLRDAGLPDSLDGFHGIDSINLRFNFENNSAFAHTTLEYDLIICGTLIRAEGKNNGVVRWLDSLPAPLDTLHLALAAPAESAYFDLPLRDATAPLFNYIREAALNRGGSSEAAIRLAVRLADTDAGKPPLTFKRTGPAQLTLFGSYRPILTTYINGALVWGHSDTLMHDSVKSWVRYSAYTALAGDAPVFQANPVASTVYYQTWNPEDTSLAGYYTAVFKVFRDSLFRGLNQDSINILSAMAFFPLARGDSTYSEENQTLAVRMRCLFYDKDNALVRPEESVYLNLDTLITAFPAADSSGLLFPIDKFLAALTGTAYDDVTRLEFSVQADPACFNRMARLLFRKEVRIRYTYSERR